MHVISEGVNSVIKLIASKYSPHIKYKASIYTLRYENDKELLLCNTLTGEIVLLSEKEREIYNSLPLLQDQVLSDLCLHGFIVPDTCNEQNRCDKLRALFIRKYGANGIINHYNILPTTGCNARCFYCYEYNIKRVNMSDNTASNLVDFIASHRGDKKVKISWFGGEPTLGIRQIDYISGRLDQLKIPFESEMVSNAYLFDYDLIKHAKLFWHLNTIQITLDGTEDVYNRIKAYVSVKDNPYRRVLRNIQYFLDEKIFVNIRLNMDAHNVENLKSLIGELTEKYKGQTHLAIYVRLLKEDAGFSPIIHSPEDSKRLRRQYLDVQNQLEESGWSQIWRFAIPSLRAFSCMADNPRAVQCTPDGIFSKCEDCIYEYTVGSLADGINNTNMINWWQQRIAFEECANCILYPSCMHLLKHCPTRSNSCDQEEKMQRIELCYKKIEDAYQRWKSSAQ